MNILFIDKPYKEKKLKSSCSYIDSFSFIKGGSIYEWASRNEYKIGMSIKSDMYLYKEIYKDNELYCFFVFIFAYLFEGLISHTPCPYIKFAKPELLTDSEFDRINEIQFIELESLREILGI